MPIQIHSEREVSGFTLITARIVSYFGGLVTQANLLDAASHGAAAVEQKYAEIVSNVGQIPADYLVSHGEDVGVVLFAYGLTNVVESSQTAQVIKFYVLFTGAILEIMQGIGVETTGNSTFSTTDLAIFVVPLVYELGKKIYQNSRQAT